ncbi:DUF4129 domain-containing protein [Streptomyces sp. NBC_00525]|uniref:DUF4129 domain-containing protein n=1 Tax=Streptomyces sp. NBC_00525 TaxID=2903660 RepID=UPI002E820A53|nr:DUF4129 domain-containing protein [Streptomyces sp. NBC_00525]WUC93944.1 DUF4129 domain-containing protein [Streptomyces sp. NBC_00525]
MSGAGGTTALLLIRASGGAPVDTERLPAREAAERELSKGVYHENDPNPLQRALDHLWTWFSDIASAAAVAAPGGPVGLAVLLLIVVALAAALWWRLGSPQPRSRPGGDALFAHGPRSTAEHRAAAEAHAAAGRWNQAVQERMRAIVRALEERTLLEPRPGRTADEAAAEAGRALPPYAVRLRAAARVFDDVTYGGRSADRAAYRNLLELDLAVESARPQLTGVSEGAGS